MKNDSLAQKNAPNSWWPPPAREPGPSASGRTAAGLLLLAAVIGMVATSVIWRADAADRAGNYAVAAHWRPDVPMYHRQLGETVMATAPPRAEDQFLTALRENPYDQLVFADLTVTELALGRWPQAVSLTTTQNGREPSFDDYWRLANLYLARGDLQGFWRDLAVATPKALDSYFVSIDSRALTASGYDYADLRRALPPQSEPAAIAYLRAAVTHADPAPAREGLDWVLRLPPRADLNPQRQAAVDDYLLKAWNLWPDDGPAIWRLADQQHMLPGPPKSPAAPALANADFDPARVAQVARLAPSPGDPLRTILGWRWLDNPGVSAEAVLTNDVRHPTAAELQFNGAEGEDFPILEQSFQTQGPARLQFSVSGRRLMEHPEQGLSVRLEDSQGHVLTELPLTLDNDWHRFSGEYSVPAGAVQTYSFAVHFHRHLEQAVPTNNFLLTAAMVRVLP